MPRFKRLRDDKSPKQCTLDQITETKGARSNGDDKLSEYASKRNFEETPEPKGGEKQVKT